MTLDEQISNFLRDASYRVAEYTIQINDAKNADDDFTEAAESRAMLTTYMDLLYDSINPIKDDYTLLKADWPEREIIAEMEYLRAYTDMAEIPYITFTGYSPVVVQEGGSISPASGTFPPGTIGQILTYDISGNVIAQDFPMAGGMKTNETIDEYFG